MRAKPHVHENVLAIMTQLAQLSGYLCVFGCVLTVTPVVTYQS